MAGNYMHGRLITGGLSVEEFAEWLAGLTANQRAWVDTWTRSRFYDTGIIFTDPRYMMSRWAIRDRLTSQVGMERTWMR